MTKPTLSTAAREALMACFVTRGKNKGRLYSKAPGGFHSLPYAAWHGAQLACNPFKASIFGMIMMTPEQKAICEEVTAYFDARPELAAQQIAASLPPAPKPVSGVEIACVLLFCVLCAWLAVGTLK